MSVRSVVVERDLCVQSLHLAVGREDERVYLGEIAVALHVTVVELHEDLGCLIASRLVQPGFGDDLGRLVEIHSVHGIDVHPHDCVGVCLCDLFYVHSAFGGHHAQMELGGPVEGEARVVLLCYVGRMLDPEAENLVALDVHAEDRLGVLSDLFRARGYLDPACLPPAADFDLGLQHDRVTGGLGLRERLVYVVGDPARRRRYTEPGEVSLSLVLV